MKTADAGFGPPAALALYSASGEYAPEVPAFCCDEIMPQLARALAMPEHEIRPLLSVPPDPGQGDVALACYAFARARRSSPATVAAELASALSAVPRGHGWPVARVTSVGPYVNMHLDRECQARALLAAMLERGTGWSGSHAGAGHTVCIDYCSPNIAKPLHLGHLRSTAIGHAIARLHEHQGWQVVRINYLGDWGTSLGKLMVAWRLWGSEDAAGSDPGRELLRVYVLFSDAAKADSTLLDAARDVSRRVEAGDPAALALWSWLRSACEQGVRATLARLGVTFDVWDAESLRNAQLGALTAGLEAAGLLVESDGAGVVPLEGLPPCLIRRADGASLYPTRDIATAIHRQRTYEPTLSLYVVDHGQSLHFEQVFGVLRRMDMGWVARLRHVPFGVLRIGGRRLRTREGDLVYLDGVLDQAVEAAARELKSRSPGMPGLAEAASAIGVGAVVFADLKHNREQDIDMDPEEAASFDGETGPYVQYAHARCCSVLERAAEPSSPSPWTDEGLHAHLARARHESTDWSGIEAPEWSLIMAMAAFPAAAASAASSLSPHVLARWLLGLAKRLNRFYKECPVLQASPGVLQRRLCLVAGTALTLRQGLWLMGLEAPKMRGDGEAAEGGGASSANA